MGIFQKNLNFACFLITKVDLRIISAV